MVYNIYRCSDLALHGSHERSKSGVLGQLGTVIGFIVAWWEVAVDFWQGR
jgi:hypothetical protein